MLSLTQVTDAGWLEPRGEYAVAFSTELAEKLGVSAGDWITLDLPACRESNWQVIGLVFEPVDQQAAIIPRPTLLREIGQVGRATSIKVQTFYADAATEAMVAAGLRTRYETNGYEVLASTRDTALEPPGRAADH